MLIELLLLRKTSQIRNDIRDIDDSAQWIWLAGFFLLWSAWIPVIWLLIRRLGVPAWITIPAAITSTLYVLIWSWPAYFFYGLMFAFVFGLICVISLAFVGDDDV